jgi:hypothetical protein
VVADDTVLVLDEVGVEDEDTVELEAFVVVAVEEEAGVVVLVVEVAEVVDFELDIVMYATLAAAAITTITIIAKTTGAMPFLLLTSILWYSL